jgi:hypothetical protein
MMRKIVVLALAASLSLSGCNLPSAATSTATMDENIVITAAAATAFAKLSEVAGMATVTPASTLTVTLELPTFTLTPTVEVKLEPFDAICTDNVTVKPWPGRGGENIGGIFYNNGVKVVARNDNGQWWYIIFADSPTGYGWVLSSAFQFKGDVGLLPIALETADGLVFVPPVVWTVVGTPLPLPTVPNDPALRPATVTQLAKVRTCPTTSCQLIGYLQVGDQITMTGRWENGKLKWAQFEFPSGPGGKGWVDRENIQLGKDAFGGLPYFDLLGNLITPEPPTPTIDPNISPTPSRTATSAPAGPKAEITDVTTVYTLMSSLSPVLDTLNPKTKVYITAQSLNHLWFEIQYPPDTTGRAYISTKYVHLLGDFRNVPYTDANGTPLPPP